MFVNMDGWRERSRGIVKRNRYLRQISGIAKRMALKRRGQVQDLHKGKEKGRIGIVKQLLLLLLVWHKTELKDRGVVEQGEW